MNAKHAILTGLLLCSLVSAVFGFAVPNTSALASLSEMFNRIPDVAAFAKASRIPTAVSIAYGFSLALGYLVGVVCLFSPLNLPGVRSITKSMSITYKVLFTTMVVILLVLPFFFPSTFNENQKSAGFFKFVVNNPIGLIIWSSGVYLYTSMMIISIFAVWRAR